MIRAIIFDCFGVLTTEAWMPFKQQHFGHDPELMAHATELGKQANSGLMPYDDFIRGAAQLAQVSEQEVRSALVRNVPNEELFDYVRTSLKPHYKIGLLSNAGSDRLDKIFTPDQLALLDDSVLSFELGTIKPDARAYEAAAKGLGVEPNECVFVDDQERYAAAAEKVGMRGICYYDFEQFRADLEKVLAETLAK